MNQIVIIADDLTGAADSGVQFCPFFAETTLVSFQRLNLILKPLLPNATRATAVYTNSRALAAEQARARLVSVAQDLLKLEAEVYKKIDSCMRGNVGSETDALLDQLGFEASFITPAFPEMGRTTSANIHRINGIALDQTEIAHDPVTPVTESSLTRLVALQSRYPVGHLGLDFLENGLNRLIEEIEQQLLSGVRHIVFDAAKRAHLDRIAQLISALERKILPVGSAGLAGSLAKRLIAKPASDGPLKTFAAGGFNLLVCGTTSAVTEQQINKLRKSYAYEVIQLDPLLLTDQDRQDEFFEKACRIRSGLLQKNVILTIKSHQASRNAPRQTHFQATADSIVGGLGLIVKEVMADIKPAHLFLTGGDTADAVLTAIQAEGIRILGEVAAGVVRGVLIGGPLDGLPVVTKAGAFGQEDTLLVMHESWQGMSNGSRFKGSEVQG